MKSLQEQSCLGELFLFEVNKVVFHEGHGENYTQTRPWQEVQLSLQKNETVKQP